ncbi:MAG: UvrD-helicase domain-containing protein [Clostridia bacterium]|nr:UvrD-helicase domain-containing protein [Clostridia bacterium]
MEEKRITEEQNDAITIRDKSIAISAAAGAGKTFVLTERIINKICEPDGDISRMIAVTFTNDAAMSLKSKITAALSKRLAQNPTDAHISEQALLVSSAKISTIHSFCFNLIKDNIQTLGLESDIAPGDDARLEVMFSEVMDSLINDYFEGNVNDEPIANFSEFADTFGSLKNSTLLPKTLKSVYRGLSSKALYIDELDKIAELYPYGEDYEFLDTYLGKELKDYLSCAISHYKKVFEDAKEFFSLSAADDKKCAKNLGVVNNILDFVYKLVSLLATDSKYKDISSLIIEFHDGGKLSSNNSNGDNQWQFYKNQIDSFYDDFVGTKSKEAKLYAYFRYNEKALKEASKKTHDMIVNLKKFMVSFDKRLSEEKSRYHIISFDDMERLALKLLWNKVDDKPTDLALKIRDSYDEIYVDEYQDTNEIESKIYDMISRANNKFCVGDLKQSIYGFRGAVPSIFSSMLDSRKKYREAPEEIQTKVYLSQNFRSSNEVLDFCNSVFEVLMNVESIKYGIDERLITGSSIKGYPTEIGIFDKKNVNNTEASYVANRIKELHNVNLYKYSEIAILVRELVDAKNIVDELEKLNIPCTIKNTENFFDNPEILIIISVLNVIDNPSRDVYLASVLKSPIYGASFDDLILIRKQCKGTLFEALKEYTAQNDYQIGKKFLADLEFYQQKASNLTCEKLIWLIYTKMCLASILSRNDSDNKSNNKLVRKHLLQFYELSRSFTGSKYRDISDFVSYIADILSGRSSIEIADDDNVGDAVIITTIHKSKGLEYKVCFISGIQRKYHSSGRDEVSTNLKCLAPKLVSGTGFGKIKTLQYETTNIPNERNQIDEELRILYVALTRPIERTILTCTANVADFDLYSGGLKSFEKKYISEYALYNKKSHLEALALAIAGNDNYSLIDTSDIVLDSEQNECTDEIEEFESIDDAIEFNGDEKDFETFEVIEKRIKAEYGFDILNRIPSKISVSKLTPNFLDNDEFWDVETVYDDDYKPRFVEERADSAASKGTAMHHFMEFFDIKNVDKNGVELEIKRLVDNKFMSKSESELLNVPALERFFKSPIADMMRDAVEIYREKRFITYIPVSNFTNDAKPFNVAEEENLLVQGVIDCALKNDREEYIIIDYKTDSFAKGTPREVIEKTLMERHSRQLSYYRTAAKKMFGSVSHAYVYSFALNDIVEITDEESKK